MTTATGRMEVLSPSEDEVSAARALETTLRSSPDVDVALVFSVGDRDFALLSGAGAFFRALVRQVARGRSVGLVELEKELSTTEAAEILGVSRPTLVTLLKQNLIPHRLVGTHRRVPHAALLEFRKHYAPRRPAEERLRAVEALLDQWQAAEEPSEP